MTIAELKKVLEDYPEDMELEVNINLIGIKNLSVFINAIGEQEVLCIYN